MTAQFDDGKDDGALRTIGEVSRALGIKTHVLRYWEQQFAMLEPLKRSGGRRYYRSEDVDLIEEIDRLVNKEGYTLKGAEQAIASGKAAKSPDEEDISTEAKSVIADHVDPANDGGVDAFFGNAETVGATESEEEIAVQEASVSGTADVHAEPEFSRSEVLAKLKDIRSRLEQAISA